MEEDTQHDNDMGMSTSATTIDPSVVQSRIRQSASIIQQQQQQGDGAEQPIFPKLNATQVNGNQVEYRRVRCPPHRYTPLREHWEQILMPLVDYLKLQVCSISKQYVKDFYEMNGCQIKLVCAEEAKKMYPSDALCCSENFKPSWKPHCLSRRKKRGTIGRSLMHTNNLDPSCSKI